MASESPSRCSAFQANAVKAETADVRLSELVAPALEAGRTRAEEKSLPFEVDLGRDVTVHADRDLTSSILNNLLDNAFKYTDEGVVRLTASRESDAITLHVFDNCTGLSPAELTTIFEPFRRGGHAGKPGSGLGLTIAKRAAEAQGGSIGADSAGERGCHFWFTIPRSRL